MSTLEYCVFETVYYKMTHQIFYVNKTLLCNINY